LQYPLVEFTTGLVFVAVEWKESSLILSSPSLPSTFYLLLLLSLSSLLIAISVYDLKHKIIPDKLLYCALGAAFLLFLTRLAAGTAEHARLEAFGGLLFAIPFALLWFFSKGRAMGLGDAKLMLLFSWFLGFAKGLSALIIGFWVGAALALGALLLKASLPLLPQGLSPALMLKLKNLNLRTELPLGPFLVFGLFLVYLFNLDVTGLELLLETS
jgi:leader peptidase (prepilin peptidase)/N-methyltransferase